MAEDWIAGARRALLDLRTAGPAWAYRKGGSPSVEATALACFGLIASAPTSVSDGDFGKSADWLASLQGRDGSVGIAPGEPAPGWPTSYALWLWASIGGYEQPRHHAASWLLRQTGKTFPPKSDPDHIIGHNTMLVGWPWVAGTHSWLEPTALAIVALVDQGLGTHARVEEGIRLVRDRALTDGGWNYGNKAAFGNELRPQPAPTGLALLALASVREERSTVVRNAIAYLRASLPETRAAASIGWGVAGLRAWGEVPPEASHWLAESASRIAGRPDAAPRLGILLSAGGPHFQEVFHGQR